MSADNSNGPSGDSLRDLNERFQELLPKKITRYLAECDGCYGDKKLAKAKDTLLYQTLQQRIEMTVCGLFPMSMSALSEERIKNPTRLPPKLFKDNSPDKPRLRPSVIYRDILKSKNAIPTSTPMTCSKKLNFTPENLETFSPINVGSAPSNKRKTTPLMLNSKNNTTNNNNNNENPKELRNGSVITLSSSASSCKEVSEPKTNNRDVVKSKTSCLENIVAKLSRSKAVGVANRTTSNKTAQISNNKSRGELRKLARNNFTQTARERQTQTGSSLNGNVLQRIRSGSSSSSSGISDMSDLLRKIEDDKIFAINKFNGVIPPSYSDEGQRKMRNVGMPWRPPSGLNPIAQTGDSLREKLLDAEEDSLDETFLPKKAPTKKVFTNKKKLLVGKKRKSRRSSNRSSRRENRPQNEDDPDWTLQSSINVKGKKRVTGSKIKKVNASVATGTSLLEKDAPKASKEEQKVAKIGVAEKSRNEALGKKTPQQRNEETPVQQIRQEFNGKRKTPKKTKDDTIDREEIDSLVQQDEVFDEVPQMENHSNEETLTREDDEEMNDRNLTKTQPETTTKRPDEEVPLKETVIEDASKPRPNSRQQNQVVEESRNLECDEMNEDSQVSIVKSTTKPPPQNKKPNKIVDEVRNFEKCRDVFQRDITIRQHNEETLRNEENIVNEVSVAKPCKKRKKATKGEPFEKILQETGTNKKQKETPKQSDDELESDDQISLTRNTTVDETCSRKSKRNDASKPHPSSRQQNQVVEKSISRICDEMNEDVVDGRFSVVKTPTKRPSQNKEPNKTVEEVRNFEDIFQRDITTTQHNEENIDNEVSIAKPCPKGKKQKKTALLGETRQEVGTNRRQKEAPKKNDDEMESDDEISLPRNATVDETCSRKSKRNDASKPHPNSRQQNQVVEKSISLICDEMNEDVVNSQFSVVKSPTKPPSQNKEPNKIVEEVRNFEDIFQRDITTTQHNEENIDNEVSVAKPCPKSKKQKKTANRRQKETPKKNDEMRNVKQPSLVRNTTVAEASFIGNGQIRHKSRAEEELPPEGVVSDEQQYINVTTCSSKTTKTNEKSVRRELQVVLTRMNIENIKTVNTPKKTTKEHRQVVDTNRKKKETSKKNVDGTRNDKQLPLVRNATVAEASFRGNGETVRHTSRVEELPPEDVASDEEQSKITNEKNDRRELQEVCSRMNSKNTKTVKTSKPPKRRVQTGESSQKSLEVSDASNAPLRRSTRVRRIAPPRGLLYFECASKRTSTLSSWSSRKTHSNSGRSSFGKQEHTMSDRTAFQPIMEEPDEADEAQPSTSKGSRTTKRSVISGRVSKRQCGKKPEKRSSRRSISVDEMVDYGNNSEISSDDQGAKVNSWFCGKQKFEPFDKIPGISMALTHNNAAQGYSTGWLKISPGMLKPQQITKTHLITFAVMEGQAEIGMQGFRKQGSEFATFVVPKGSEYYIKNLSKSKDLVLNFTTFIPHKK